MGSDPKHEPSRHNGSVLEERSSEKDIDLVRMAVM